MENGSAPRRGRPRRFDRTEALARAMRLFWDRGYTSTSVADLAQAMALNPPSLYAAFGDKRQLYLEAVDLYLARFGQQIADAVAAPGAARDAVERALHKAVSVYLLDDHPKGCMVAAAITTCGPEAQDIAARLAEHRDASRQRFAARIADDVDALPLGTSPDDLANFYAATLFGLSTLARDGATAEALRRVVDRAMQAWPGDAKAS